MQLIWCQIRYESAESGTATVAGQDSLLLLAQFPLVMHRIFQYDCYSQFVLLINACAVCVLRKLGLTYITNDASEHIKPSTAIARACEVSILPNLDPAKSGPTKPVPNDSNELCII